MFLRKIFASACQHGFYLCLCFSLFVINTSYADTCNCPPMEDTDDAFYNSDLVIIGTVSDLKSSVFQPGYMEIIFDIRKLVKSNSIIPTSNVVIYVPNNECKYNFKFGDDYIVYAKGDLFFYRTDVCARNLLFDISFDEIERLSKFDETEPL